MSVVVDLRPSVSWLKDTHESQVRRVAPNEIFSSRREIVARVLSRVEFLREVQGDADSDLPPYQPETVPDDQVVVHKRSLIDECDIYTSASGYIFVSSFVAGDYIFNVTKGKSETEVYVGVLSTSRDDQMFIVARVVTSQNRMHAHEVVIYKDSQRLNAVVTYMRELSDLNAHKTDEIIFFDGTTVSPEDLYWHYTHLLTAFDTAFKWTGVRFPIRVTVHDDDDDTTVTTYIKRPYVHMIMKYATPVEVNGTLTLLIETKHGVDSVQISFPRYDKSIGLPALSNGAGLIVLMHCEQSLLTQVEVLAYNYPFLTPLSGATLELDFEGLPAVDDNFDIFDDDVGFISEAIVRLERKKWVGGELDDIPSHAALKTQSLPFNGLSFLSLHMKEIEVVWKKTETDGNTLLVLSDLEAPVLRMKTKYRFVVAYVLDGKAHKRSLKFKTSNIASEDVAYSFDLPGPLRLYMVLAFAGKRRYALRSLYVDTLTKKEVEDDFEEWARSL
jgi:hypothetical protein